MPYPLANKGSGAASPHLFTHSIRRRPEIKNIIPDNSRVYADRTLLGEATYNLFSNAIKFCKRGDKITISLEDDDKTAICISDTGPGIKPEVLERIFKDGAKITTEGTAGEIGTGLGLQLAKDIMELHGGELRAVCEIAHGCAFSLKLPFVRPKILLVDDDPRFRFLLEIHLKPMEVEIIQAADGEEAWAALERDTVHLVISDIEMPFLDGLKLLEKIKANSATKDIPVIVVSGEHGMEIRDAVFKLGGEDFVTKERIGPVDFLPRVRRFIG